MNRDLMRVLMLALLAFVLVLVGKARAGELEFSAASECKAMRGCGVEMHYVSE